MSEDRLEAWLGTLIGKYVKSYIEGGFSVFPCHGINTKEQCTCGKVDCNNAGKHPACQHGLRDAVKDLREAAELFHYRDDLNIGIATGKASNIFVLDIDAHKGGKNSLKRLQANIAPLPKTPIVNTGGGGYHLVFSIPTSRIGNGVDVFGKEYPGIDVRTTGGYVVWPPSKHKSGGKYEFADGSFQIEPPMLPDIYEDMLSIKPTYKIDRDMDRGFVGMDVEHREWSIKDVVSMLACISPDLGYDEWIAICMAIHDGGYPFYVCDDWSASQGSKKYKGSADVRFHWDTYHQGGGVTIGTLIDKAKLNGWSPDNQPVDPEALKYCDTLLKKMRQKMADKHKGKNTPAPKKNKLRSNQDVKKKKDRRVEPFFLPKTPEPPKMLPLSFDPLQVPGVLGRTVQWINKYAIFYQPELALMNVLTFAGAVFGRRYETPLSTRSNLYMVGIARTGGGKDHSRKMIGRLAMEAGISQFIGANSIRSESGLLRSLTNNASQLMMLDEFGLLMQAISDPRAPHHVRAISSIFLKVYSHSNSVYHHGDLADDKAKPLKIAYPNLCIYGTSTQESYVSSLKKTAITSGEMNRFLVIPSRGTIERQKNTPRIEPDAELVEWWKQFAPNPLQPLGNNANNGNIAPVPKVVEWGECEKICDAIFEEQMEKWNDEKDNLRDLWSRLAENTLKVAMILAIARDPVNPVFSEEDFDYAYSIVTYSINAMTGMATDGMMETLHEANHKEMLEFLLSNPDGCRKSEILRRFRKWKKKESEDLLSVLIDQEYVRSEKVFQDRGAPTIVFKAVAHQ